MQSCLTITQPVMAPNFCGLWRNRPVNVVHCVIVFVCLLFVGSTFSRVQLTRKLDPNFVLTMQINSFYRNWGKHYICFILLFTDTHAEVVHFYTLLLCNDVAINLFSCTMFAYRSVSAMQILCIMYHTMNACIMICRDTYVRSCPR